MIQHTRLYFDNTNAFLLIPEILLNIVTKLVELFLPNVTFIMKGGSQFNIYGAIAPTSKRTATIYCLVVVKSPDVNIIGQNFMTGYRIVFNREQTVLGWKPFNCYEIVDPRTQQKIPQIPKESPTTINAQPRFVHGGTPRNEFWGSTVFSCQTTKFIPGGIIAFHAIFTHFANCLIFYVSVAQLFCL
ncbi:hypothetical protein MKW92_033645 [Papaver armeniacum]|nr:hypothetical protein MKW92_033645 [Papaver armeniacum]